MKYPREIQAGAQRAVQVPEASLQQNPWGKAKQEERGAGSGLTVGPCSRGRGGASGAARATGRTLQPELELAGPSSRAPGHLASKALGLLGLSSFLPPSFCFSRFVHRILFLSVLGGQLRCRTRCR